MANELDYLCDSEVTLPGTSVTLPEALAAVTTKGAKSIHPRLKKIAVIPASNVTVNITSSSSVSAASPPILSSGMSMWLSATSSSSIKLIGTGRMSVFQQG